MAVVPDMPTEEPKLLPDVGTGAVRITPCAAGNHARLAAARTRKRVPKMRSLAERGARVEADKGESIECFFIDQRKRLGRNYLHGTDL
jgi:hypothetical protein